MKLKRRLSASLAAGAILTAASLGFTAAASAAAGNVSFTFSPTGANPVSGPVSGSITAHCADTVCSISQLHAVAAGAGGADSVDLGSVSPNAADATLNFTWNTVAAARHNGTYTLSADTKENSVLPLGDSTAAGATTFKVNNPPSAPTGVQATLDPAANNTPVVTWNPNAEPDVTGYEVFRSDGGAPPVPVASAHDTSAPQGIALTYFVVAVRSSPVFPSGITSCRNAAPCQPAQLTAATAGGAAPVTVPVPPPPPPPPAPAAAAAAAPIAVATADPVPAPPAPAGAPIAASGVTGATGTATVGQQPLGFVHSAPVPISGPTLPTTIVQLPAPKVVQFAPLLPYSGKIPEVPKAAAAVPAPVQANTTEVQTTEIQVPVLGHVKPVDAAKYFAAAGFLIVGAIHVIRLAHRLTHPDEVGATTTGGASLGAGTLSLTRRSGLRFPMPFRRSGS